MNICGDVSMESAEIFSPKQVRPVFYQLCLASGLHVVFKCYEIIKPLMLHCPADILSTVPDGSESVQMFHLSVNSALETKIENLNSHLLYSRGRKRICSLVYLFCITFSKKKHKSLIKRFLKDFSPCHMVNIHF